MTPLDIMPPLGDVSLPGLEPWSSTMPVLIDQRSIPLAKACHVRAARADEMAGRTGPGQVGPGCVQSQWRVCTSYWPLHLLLTDR